MLLTVNCLVWCLLQDAPCAPGRPIKKQQQIRLQHGATRKWLHSHSFYSPMSGNQEVCMREDWLGDSGCCHTWLGQSGGAQCKHSWTTPWQRLQQQRQHASTWGHQSSARWRPAHCPCVAQATSMNMLCTSHDTPLPCHAVLCCCCFAADQRIWR